MSRNTALYLLEHLPESLKYCDPTSFKFSFRRSPTEDQRQYFLYLLRELALCSDPKNVVSEVNLQERLPNEKQDSELYKNIKKEVTDLNDFIMECEFSYILKYKDGKLIADGGIAGPCFHINDTISLFWHENFIRLLNRYPNEIVNAAIQALEEKKQCKTD